MHNLEAALFAQGCSETERVLRLVGATPGFAFGLPSAGDLFVTVQGGRSMRLGRLLGLGRTFVEAESDLAGLTLEAAEIVHTMGAAIPKLQARGLLLAEDLPFMRTLVDIVVHGRPPVLPLDAFFCGQASA